MNCTEIVNPFQGCASGFSPVMMIVKVFEDQKWSSSRNIPPFGSKTSPGSPFHSGRQHKNTCACSF